MEELNKYIYVTVAFYISLSFVVWDVLWVLHSVEWQMIERLGVLSAYVLTILAVSTLTEHPPKL